MEWKWAKKWERESEGTPNEWKEQLPNWKGGKNSDLSDRVRERMSGAKFFATMLLKTVLYVKLPLKQTLPF